MSRGKPKFASQTPLKPLFEPFRQMADEKARSKAIRGQGVFRKNFGLPAKRVTIIFIIANAIAITISPTKE